MENQVWLQFFLYFFSLLLFLLFITKKNCSSKKSLPPGPPKLPIIGNLHQLGALPHLSMYQLSKKYGPLMQLQLGNIPTLVVSSAETAKHVFKTYNLECCSRPPLTVTGRFSYNYLDIAFCPYGKFWRETRKICVQELLCLKKVQSFRSTREDGVALMIDSIYSGNPVNLSQKFLSLNMELISRVAVGKSFQDSDLDSEKFQRFIQEALYLIGSFSATDYFPYIGFIIDRFTGLHGKLESCFHGLDFYFQKIIDDHLLTYENKYQEDEDIIDVLLKIMKNQTDSSDIQINHDIIKAILMNLFLAGVETNSTGIGWAMVELVKNPEVMKKAQEEIRNYVGNKGKVSESDLDHLIYFKMVIKESLRLHPPAALLISRETMSEFDIDGHRVYPKTQILVNAWAIGRDPESWENPDIFYPERLEDSLIDFKGQHFELLPFGAGRRVCPGMSMAMVILEHTVANLLYHFDWKLPYGMKEEDLSMEEAPGLTNYKKEDLILVPTKYQFGE